MNTERICLLLAVIDQQSRQLPNGRRNKIMNTTRKIRLEIQKERRKRNER